jgi:hypothetical protein
MKKILSGVLCGALLASMCVNAFAANISTDGGSEDVKVTYGVTQAFTVTIPADFTIDQATNKAVAQVSASNVMIEANSVLEVTINGHDYTDKWELVDTAESSNKLDYTIGKTEGASDIVNGSVVLSVAAGEAFDSTVAQDMHFTVVEELTKAGTYNDTLTFNVNVR